MASTEVNYYVLFEDYTQGMALLELLQEERIRARVTPTPRVLHGELSCGMALLIVPEDIEAVRDCIARHGAGYHSIEKLPCQINSHRYRFC